MQSFSLLFIVALVLINVVNAHFTLSGPVPSREKQEYPNDNRRFWPIASGTPLRPLNNCLKYKRRQVARLSPGQQVIFPFEIGNGASHVGMCTASLINLSTGKTTNLGQVLNCVSLKQRIVLRMPTTACTNCVIKVKVAAVHLGPTKPEYYDSCVDVNIGGAAVTTKSTVSSSTTTSAATTSSQGAACSTGVMTCSANGKQVLNCISGHYQATNVAPGTICTTKLTGHPVIAHSS